MLSPLGLLRYRFSTMFYKGDSFCESLFIFPHTKPIYEKGSSLNGNKCSHGEQGVSFQSLPFPEGSTNNFESVMRSVP